MEAQSVGDRARGTTGHPQPDADFGRVRWLAAHHQADELATLRHHPDPRRITHGEDHGLRPCIGDGARFVVSASWYADAGITLRLARHSVLVQLRNVFGRRVYTGGYPGPAMDGADRSAMEPYYYTLAPKNLTVNARLV